MAAAPRRRGQATTAGRSPGGPVAVATTMALLCLFLGGCGEVMEEDGTPTLGEAAFFTLTGALCLAACGCGMFFSCGKEDRESSFNCAVCCAVLGLLSAPVFLILLAPRWHMSIKCKQSLDSLPSPSCNGHGSMDCNRDFLGSADRPRCRCARGWKGPTCNIGTTTTTTSTTTTSTQTTMTPSTTWTTTSTTTLLCPGGSGPKVNVDIILDPNVDCPGASLGMSGILGAFVGAIVAGAPVLVVLWMRHRQELMLVLIFDVIVASLDVGSDLFWVLTGVFYANETLIPAVFFTVSPSFLYTTWFFGRCILLWPERWAKHFCKVVVVPAFLIAAQVLTTMFGMLKQHMWRFSAHCGCFQFRQTIDGSLDIAFINILFWVGTVLLAAGGLVTIFCVALLFFVAGLLLCSCLLLFWLPASVLWCVTHTLLLMLLHVTRLAALRPINKHVYGILCPSDSADAAPAVEPATAPTSAADDTTKWVDPRLWHGTLLVEAVLESVPCFIINIVDMALLIEVGLDTISFQGVLAACSSLVVILRILFRYFYWLVYKGVPLKDVKIEYQTSRDATGAAAGAAGSVFG